MVLLKNGAATLCDQESICSKSRKCGLTPKQARFVDEYLVDHNATQAAIRAGYSERTARQVGSENLAKPVIAAEVCRRFEELARRNGIFLDRVVGDLEDGITADLADLMDSDGAVLPVGEWPAIWRRGLVTELTMTEEQIDDQTVTRRIISLRLADRTALKRLLARHLGLLG